MKRCAKNTIGVLVVACGLVATGVAAEEESKVYESLDDVAVGRIFLSPAQRSSLDARRGKESPVATANLPAATSMARHSPDAAGYILRSGGPSRVWSNGNFVPARDVSGVTFPGDVEVIRNSERELETNPGASDDGS